MSFHCWLRLRKSGGPRHARTGRSRRRPSTGYRPRLESFEDRRLLSAGGLDPTFGNGAGFVATSVSSYGSGAESVLVQPDGKILAAGTASLGTGNASPPDVFAVVRYQADGSVDASFGSGGHAFADFPGNSTGGYRYSIANAAALYPQAGTVNDGKIVLAGQHDTQNGATFALARFNADGTLDRTFGTDTKHPGEVTTTFPTTKGDYQEAFGVVIQTDGKIVASGSSSSSGFLLARYNTNGTLDTTFGQGGKVITSSFGVALSAGTLLLQPDGKLTVVGESHPAYQTWVVQMARYNSNGSLDTSFGTGGLLTSSVVVSNNGVKAALYPPGTANAGDIAVVGQTAGRSGGNVEIARFTPNGTLDSTFGSGGTVTGQIGDYAADAVAADGKLVVSFASKTGTYTPPQFGVARYNTDGSPDSTFGTDGYVSPAFAGYSAGDADAVALQSNGDILVAGQVYFTGPNNLSLTKIAVARYLPSDPQIGSFTATPNPVTAGNDVTLTATNIADANPGATVKQVAIYLDSNGDGALEPGTDTLIGYASQTSPGAWTYRYTVNLAPGTYTLFGQSKDSYGVLGDPVATTLNVV